MKGRAEPLVFFSLSVSTPGLKKKKKERKKKHTTKKKPHRGFPPAEPGTFRHVTTATAASRTARGRQGALPHSGRAGQLRCSLPARRDSRPRRSGASLSLFPSLFYFSTSQGVAHPVPSASFRCRAVPVLGVGQALCAGAWCRPPAAGRCAGKRGAAVPSILPVPFNSLRASRSKRFPWSHRLVFVFRGRRDKKPAGLLTHAEVSRCECPNPCS